MKRYLAIVALLGLACSGQLSTGPEEQSTVTGPLRLTVTDSLAQPGVLFALPSVTVSPAEMRNSIIP